MIDATRRTALTGLLAAAGAGLLSGRATAAVPEGFDAVVQQAMRDFGLPGLAISIVEDGKVTLAKGYGVKRLGSPEPVTADTLFPIGSNTKAMTCTAIAMLVEEGKLAWEDKVKDRLPGFAMSDDYVTREMTVVDLLVHRSGLGLGAGDLLFWPKTDFKRPEVVERLRHIKLTGGFREGFAYDNILYIVAGELIAAVSGVPYETFIAERLLKPLGMNRSVIETARLKPSEVTQLHGRISGPVRGLGPQSVLKDVYLSDMVSPSGGVWSSANDMTRWLATQAALGVTPDGKRLWSEKIARRMWFGETIMRASPFPGRSWETQRFSTYAMGWGVEEYSGEAFVGHTGGVQGALSVVAVLPTQKVAFCILTNGEEDGVGHALRNILLDHYLGTPKRDWLALAKSDAEEARKQMTAAAAQGAVVRPANAKAPALPAAAYARTYRDAWYGDIVVREKGGKLFIDFTRSPTLKGALEPWDGETFRTRFTDPASEDAFVTFNLENGKVTGAKLKAVSPFADFSYDYQDLDLKPA